MPLIEQTLRLASDKNYGRRPPPAAPGLALHLLPMFVRQSVSMAFEGRTCSGGRWPEWLERAADIRFIGISGDADTVLHFQSPQLGEAAESIFRQPQVWATRPDPLDTGLDLLGDVICDLRERKADSDRFDKSLLRRVRRLGKIVSGEFQSVAVCGHRFADSPAIIDRSVIEHAAQLAEDTPRPSRARVVGTLDMIRASTQAFALKLDDGQEVHGVLTSGVIDELSKLWQRRVLVIGTAVFRASGSLLRIDADGVAPADGEPPIWSRMPQPDRRHIDRPALRKPQNRQSGLAAMVGRWPGDESDEELDAALREIS